MVTVRLHETTIDCIEPAKVGEFWAALLGGDLLEPMPGWLRLDPPSDGSPLLNFQPVPEPKEGKSRVHLDLITENLDEAVARALALGGRETGERHEYDEGTVVVLADAQGTEFCTVAYVWDRAAGSTEESMDAG